jgi:hypothetical protein
MMLCQEQRESHLGVLFYVLNRSVGRLHMFGKESDFEAVERVMVEAHLRQPMRIVSSSPWPVERPANWTARVNAPLTTTESDRVRVSIERGRPYGDERWVR